MSFGCGGAALLSQKCVPVKQLLHHPQYHYPLPDHVTLTRYWSRCRSVSGVNSEDMGMTSPFLMIMALEQEKCIKPL